MNNQYVTKSATFKGSFNDLDMFAFCGIRHASIKRYHNGTMKIKWICESDIDIHEFIDVEQMENYNIELIEVKN